MKNNHIFFRMLFLPGGFLPLWLLAISVLISNTVVNAQQGGPGVAWTSGVNFQSNLPCDEDAWAYDAEEMSNGDLISVGYTTSHVLPEDCADRTKRRRTPAYAVTDKFGNLKNSVYYSYNDVDGTGALARIAKDLDGGVIMAGWQGAKALITKLDVNYNQVWVGRFDLPLNNGVERLFAVEVLPDGRILLSGGYKGGTPDQGETFFIICHYNTNTQSVEIDELTEFGNIDGKILDCKTVTVGNNTYVLSTGYKVRGTQGERFAIASDPTGNTDKNADGVSLANGTTTFPVQDWDVLVGIFNINQIGSNNPPVMKVYNSTNFEFDNFNDPLTPTIWQELPCVQQFGPLTPGRSVSGWGYEPVNRNGSPVADHYLKHVSKDVGRTIAYSNTTGRVYVAAEMNTLEMTGGNYTGMHRTGHPGVVLKGLKNPDGSDCAESEHTYGAYKDAHIHLIEFDLAGNLLNYRNVAHCSGGDFYASIVADETDGKIVLGTTTVDRNICGLPAIDFCNDAEVNLLMKIDPVTLNPVWQQHQLVLGEGNCAFGLIQTADGGFVMIGNNEIETNQGHDETFNIIRFTPDCQAGQNFHQDADYTVTTSSGAGGEIWSPLNKPNPYRIRGNIIIPSGKKLTIKDGLVVEFASTKNTPDHRKSGITVLEGGYIAITSGAVLKGLDCGGEQMWDGITVLGLPNAPQTIQQGRIAITSNARIENAVRGTVLGKTGWQSVVKEVVEGSTISTSFTNTYMDNLGFGGGRIISSNAIYRNCGAGVVWNPHIGFSNNSFLVSTKFEFTGALADPLYAFSCDVPSLSRPTASELGCRLRSVSEVRFMNCSFISTEPSGFYEFYRNRPSGIYGTDAKFSFGGGAFPIHFKDLYIGTESAAMLSGVTTTFSFTGAKMDNVYQGLNVRGNITPVVQTCEYHHIPDREQPKSGSASGTFSKGTQGLTLYSNIYDSNAAYDSYGAIVNNSLGTGGAKVEFNMFTDFNIANEFEEDNSSLQTRCNTYLGGVGDVSWDVKGAFPSQAQVQNPNNPFPDNKFLWDCDSPLDDIRSIPMFNYLERQESALNTNTILKCKTPTVTIPPNTNNQAANCAFYEPCPNPPYCNELYAKYLSTGKPLYYRNDLLNAYVRMSASSVPDSLTLPGATRAISLLLDRNQQEDKKILAATYASLGNYPAAYQYLQQIVGTSTESQDFIAYYSVMINAGLAGRDAYHLTKAEFNQLAPLMQHNTAVAENVKVLDHLLNGVYHPLEVQPGLGGRNGDRSEEQDATIVAPSGLSVFPNPFSNEVRFTAPEGASISALMIMDISGKVIFDQKYSASETLVTWQANDIKEGILIYNCRLSNGESTYGKLVHMKKQ